MINCNCLGCAVLINAVTSATEIKGSRCYYVKFTLRMLFKHLRTQFWTNEFMSQTNKQNVEKFHLDAFN